VQVVLTPARVGVDEEEAFVLPAQCGEHVEQQDVLVDIGKVAGVILVAILHETPKARERRLYTVLRTRMKTLDWLLTVTILGGAVSAGATADGTSPSRPVLSRGAGLAPPARIPPALGESTQPPGSPVATADIPKSVRRAVVADAARRFKVAESAVVLTRAEQVTWGDGSLGCPELGMSYTQNLVPGYVIVAKTDAGELTYHTDTREQARNCAGARPKTNRKLPETLPGPTVPPPDR